MYRSLCEPTAVRGLRLLKDLAITLWYDPASSEERQFQDQLRHFLWAASKLKALALTIDGGPIGNEAPFVNLGDRYHVFRQVLLLRPHPMSEGWTFEVGSSLRASCKTSLDCLCADRDRELVTWGSMTMYLTGARLTGFDSVIDYRRSNIYDCQKVTPEVWASQAFASVGCILGLEQVWINVRVNSP